MVRGRRSIGVALVALVLGGCQGSDTGEQPTGGLALYLDGALVRRESPADLARRPTDYVRGELRGWSVVGGLYGDIDPARVAALDISSEGGRRLTLDRAQLHDEDLLPVVFVDRSRALRFTMARREAQETVPHGRGPGDGRGGGNRRGAQSPLTVDHVSELRLTTGPPPTMPPPQPLPRGDQDDETTPGQLALDIAGVRTVVEAKALERESGTQAWSLRDLVGRRTAKRVTRVELRGGRGGDHLTIDAAAWAGPARLDLRLNRRGFFKLESDLGRVRDVLEIDVAVE